MTFAARPNRSSGGPVTALGGTLGDVNHSGASATWNFGSTGTIAKSGNANSGAANWFLPATPGVGSSFWIKFTLNSGTLWGSGPTSGAINSLAAGGAISYSATPGHAVSANVTVQIYSDAGGANQVGSGTILVNVDAT